MLRKVHIYTRDYSEWKWFDGFTLENTDYDLNPLTLKLFTEDIIEIIDGNPQLLHSSVRQMKYMPGILKLSKGIVYTIESMKFYECSPDDKRFPTFLIKNDSTDELINELFDDIYITFSFKEWNDDIPYPVGEITNNIGTINNLSNFYEYQLYCKSLYASLQDFTEKTVESLKQKTEEEFINSIMLNNLGIEDRTNEKIYTIDPLRGSDFDDGIGIIDIDDETVRLTVYISNVAMWMEVLDIWNSFSERISTIYLPDRKRPMLPNILCDCLCSLQENSKRFAYCLDVFIKNNKIINTNIKNTLIKVYKNYRYEEPSLLIDPNYIKTFSLLQNLCRENKLIQSVKDSHDVIAYLAILINSKCADVMIQHKNGIFRSVVLNNRINLPHKLPDDVCKFLKIWNCSTGQYSTHSDQLGHILVSDGVEHYIHISSPIRRLVDLLNSIKLQENVGIFSFGENAHKFYNKWLGKLDYINVTMRAIRKIQTDCALLELFTNSPDTKDRIFKGYVFDKIKRNDGLFQYIVYLHHLKIVSRITVRTDIENYEEVSLKVFIFIDEITQKRKIRLQIM
jgi:hypothetical protein